MSHPFDATLKEIVEAHAADYAPAFGLPVGLPTETLNVDLSTLTAATDVAFGFGNPLQEVADLNFQSGPDAQLESRLLLYSAALHHHFGAPVRSLLIMLRPAADHARLNGRYAFASGGGRVEFQYDIVRLWQQPVSPFLQGGLGLLPLATLCQMPPGLPLTNALLDVVREIDRRLRSEAPHERAAQLMTAAFILTGMRVPRDVLSSIYQGVRLMHDSSAYELILDEGRAEGLSKGQVAEAQRLLMRLGRRKLGSLNPTDEQNLLAITDLDRLERMADAILTAGNWSELLATP